MAIACIIPLCLSFLLSAAVSADTNYFNFTDIRTPHGNWNLTFLKELPYKVNQPAKPELHVAHCMAGALRSLYFPSVYKIYKKSAIDALGAPSKLFFVAGTENNTARYKAAFEYLDPVAVLYVTRSEVLGGNLKCPRCSFQWQWQYTKYAICFELVRRYERYQVGMFSHVIITRPDVLVQPVGPASGWRRDMFMAPPTEYAHEDPPLAVSTVFKESFGDVEFPRSDLYPRRVTEIFNIVPRVLARRLFGFLTAPIVNRIESDGTGDRIWFLILESCNLTISWHPIEYHLIRDADDPVVLENFKKRLPDATLPPITPPDVIPKSPMILYRTE